MGSDELIKHMSNVPCYLQRMEKGKGGTLQEKALNFGVLDWRRLERWTDDRRPVPGDGKQPTASPVTPSCRNSSSSLSYLTTLRNQRPSLNSRWDSSVAEALAQCKLRVDLEARGEEFRRKVPGLEDVSPEGKTSASTSKNGESSSSFVRNGRKPVKLRSDGGEGGRNLLHDGQSQTPRRWQCGLNDLLPEHLEGGDLHGSRRFSYSSTRDHAAPAEPGRASFLPAFMPSQRWPDLNSLGSDLCETSLRRDEPAGLKPNGGEDTPAVMLRRKPTGVEKAGAQTGQKDLRESENDPPATSYPPQAEAFHLKEPGLLSERRPPSSVGRISSSSDGDSMKGRRSPSSGLPAADGEDSIREVSRRQALLRVSWKDGVPLFTFSINENEILAATRKKKGGSGKEGCECVYTFYYVTEARQKIRGWMKQGNRGKKELISNVVGQMNVSSVRSPEERRDAVREFVLFGPELWPTFHETWDHPVPNSELAAVVLSGAPLEAARATAPSTRTAMTMAAEIHRRRSSKRVSSGFERWWPYSRAKFMVCRTPENRRHSLNGGGPEGGATGGGRDGRPFFSLVSFKEGLYRVDFDSSIAVVQAFAVCVSVLHGRKRGGLHELLNSRLTAAVAGGAPMSAPYRPPLSPVGRA
ncbi:unnamed protein product [Spirodela intermedia]|uniref:Uncharacterized protein n=1 Tax=Spirodela intermedia TaxID=51605 RepID=A0A7I8JH20_SPIIN|nr:unnamed protein product [Spirodela intermedia]CAA6669434.1 unnamed protein product [Spirodela intermedia]